MNPIKFGKSILLICLIFYTYTTYIVFTIPTLQLWQKIGLVIVLFLPILAMILFLKHLIKNKNENS